MAVVADPAATATPVLAMLVQQVARNGLTGSATTDAALVAALITAIGWLISSALSRRVALDVLDSTQTHQRQMALDAQAGEERMEFLKQRLARRERRVQPLR